MRVRYVIERGTATDEENGKPVALGLVDTDGSYVGGGATPYTSIEKAKADAESTGEVTSWRPAPKEWQPDTLLVSNWYTDEGWSRDT